MRFFVARFHTTKPANAAWAANVRASLARLWVRFWSCRRTTHLGGLSALCVLHAATESCCPPITVVTELVRSIHVCWWYIFLRKKRRTNEKHNFEIIFPEKFSYIKVNKIWTICSETIFYRIFFWKDATIYLSAEIIFLRRFQKIHFCRFSSYRKAT